VNAAAGVRALLALAFVLALDVAASLGAAQPAAACSRIGFNTSSMREYVDQAAAVAVGTFGERNGDAIAFQVTEALKGTAGGATLTIVNRIVDDCPLNHPVVMDGSEQPYAPGQRALMILGRKSLVPGADWYVMGDAAYLAGHDGSLGILPSRAGLMYPSEIKRRLQENDVPVNLDLERKMPCVAGLHGMLDAPADINRLSPLIVVGKVASLSGDEMSFSIEDTWRGKPPGQRITVDNRWYSVNPADCSTRPQAMILFHPGERVLLFLRPAAHGVGDWELALWGTGWLYPAGDGFSGGPLPTLDDLRRVTGRPAQGDAGPLEYTLVVLGPLLAAAFVIWFASFTGRRA